MVRHEHGGVTATGVVAGRITLLAYFLVVALPAPAQPAPATQAFILTQDSVIGADLSASGISASRRIAGGTTRKIAQAGSFVFLQRGRAVEVLRAQTLDSVHTRKFPEEIEDIAASGSVLFVSVGREIHIVRIAPTGRTSILTAILLQKRVHALTARGASVYAIDDVVLPFYAHYIDVERPHAPHLTTFAWSGGVGAHLVTQAIADRWYVLGSYSSGGLPRVYHSDLEALPLRPPLQSLGRWKTNWGMREFRVHAAVLYWVWGGGERDERSWLFRRGLQQPDAPAEKVVPLEAPFALFPELSGEGSAKGGHSDGGGRQAYTAWAGANRGGPGRPQTGRVSTSPSFGPCRPRHRSLLRPSRRGRSPDTWRLASGCGDEQVGPPRRR